MEKRADEACETKRGRGEGEKNAEAEAGREGACDGGVVFDEGGNESVK